MLLSEWNSFVLAVAINFRFSKTLDKCCEILTFCGDDGQDYILGGDVLWFGRWTLDILVVESSFKMLVPVYNSAQSRVLEEYNCDKKFCSCK